MADLGDPWENLSVEVRDTDGELANAGDVDLTITKPDGTTVTPAVSNVSTGVYAPTDAYFPDAVGRWVAYWQATGDNASAYTQTLNVREATRDLFSLTEGREALNLTAGNTISDEELRRLIGAVTAVVEDVVGPVISRSFTEQHTSGGRAVALSNYPVLTVTSVVSYVGSGATTWTQVATPALASGNSYTLNAASGVLTAEGGASFGDRVYVTYTAGRSAVDANIAEAATIIMQQLWRTGQQGGIRGGGGDIVPSGFAIPNRAMELLKPHAQAGGFA